MSSNIVSQETMNNIINGLYWDHEFKRTNGMNLSLAGLREAKDFQALGDDLYSLNARGTGQTHNREEMLYRPAPKFEWVDEKPSNPWQVLKSLHCLRYQCAEGDNELIAIYQLLEKIIQWWTYYCISTVQEYKDAKWNI